MSSTPTITVVRRDGTIASCDGYEVVRSIEAAAHGLTDSIARATQLQAELEITLFDGITTEQLDEAMMGVALQNAKDDPDLRRRGHPTPVEHVRPLPGRPATRGARTGAGPPRREPGEVDGDSQRHAAGQPLRVDQHVVEVDARA